MTEAAARPSRRLILLLLLAVAWLLAQAMTLDIGTIFSGFNVNGAATGAHHAYSLTNVGACLAVVIGAVAFLLQRGRWRSVLVALAAGGVGVVLQLVAAAALHEFQNDPAHGGSVSTPAMRAGAEAAVSAFIAAGSTGLLGLVAAVVGFATGERGRPLTAEVREGGIVLARSLRLGNFNVLSWLFGPVFQADVRVTGRRRGTYISRAVYLLILLGIVTIAWFGLRMDLDLASGADRLQRMQELAPQLAMFLLWTQFIMLLFIAPLLTAPVICQERTGRTLPALLTTPLTGAQIIFGKLAGRLMMAIVLILLSVPLLLGVRVYGGLDTGFVLKAVAITMSATVFAASLGLLASIWSKRATTAGVTAFIMLAVHSIALPLLLAAVMFGLANQPRDWVVALSPIATLFMLTLTALGDPGPFASTDLWLYNVAFNLGFTAVVCLVATLSFRRVMTAEAHGRTITLGKKRKRRRANAAPIAPRPLAEPSEIAGELAVAPAPAAPRSSEDEEFVERASREVGDNPVLWREIRQSAVGGGSKLSAILTMVGTVGLILMLNLYFGPAEEGLHYIVLACAMVLLCASAAVAATGTVSGEREAGAWTILLTTPLSGSRILLGKFLGACRRCWLIPALILLDSIIAIAAGAFSPEFLIHLAIIIPSTIIFLCGTGTLLSLTFRKQTTAGVANLSLAVGLWFGLPMLVAFAGEMSGVGNDLEVVFTGIVSISPVPMAVVALAGSADPSYVQSRTYDMPGGNMTLLEFTLLIVVSMSILAGAGLGALGLAAARFRFGSERTS